MGPRRAWALLGAVALVLIFSCALATTRAAAATPTSSSSFLLRHTSATKGQLLQLSGSAAALTSTGVWSGALASGSQFGVGSFDGGAAAAALLSLVGKSGARLDLFSAQPDGSYAPSTVWHAAKAGLSVPVSHLVAADTNGDGHDELLVLAPLGRHGAQVLGFSFTASAASRHILWQTRKASFTVKGAQLAAADLNGDGKTDLVILTRSGNKGHLYGLTSSGARLTLALRWQGAASAAARLAAGPLAGSAKGAAFLLRPTSASKATLTRFTQTKHTFAARRAWSGKLAGPVAQLACSDLNSDGAGDLLVLAGKGHAVNLTALLAASTGYRAGRCWQASLASASLRLACAPSGVRVLAPATTALQGAGTAALTAVSADQMTLSFSGTAPAGVAVGKILLIEPCAAAPDGLLRKVTDVSTSGGVTTVTTTQAALDQAFQSLDLSLSQQITGADLARARLAPGVHLVATGRGHGPRGSKGSISLPSFTLALDHDFGGLAVKGSVTLAERVDLDASVNWHLGLNSAYVASVATEHSTLTCTASAGWQHDQEVDLPLAKVPTSVAGVPVVIDLELVLAAHGDFAVGVATSVDQIASFTIGAQYANGSFSPVCSPGFSASCSPPTLYGTADLKASIGPQVGVSICDVAGPYVGVDGYGEFSADSAATPWWMLHGGLEGAVGFKMQILSHTIADWSCSKTFYDHLFAQAPSGSTPPPMPTPTASPSPTPTPTSTPGSGDWTTVSAGGYHTLALKTDGTLWAWGLNHYGELGLGDTTDRSTPTQVGSASDWATVSTDGADTLALKTDGTLWAWGQNVGGQLGLGDLTDRSAPTQVGSASNWATVSAGGGDTLALKTDGTLWAWGQNYGGDLGLGGGGDRLTPTEVGSASDWAAVSTDGADTLALKTDGALWAWGKNCYGELGLGNTTDRDVPTQVGSASDWAAVSAGDDHTLALKTDGTLWAWGYNPEGQLGLGDTTERSTPTEVGSDSDWGTVSAGGYHTLALKTDGTLWAWGWNEDGELGLGDTIERDTPTEVGSP